MSILSSEPPDHTSPAGDDRYREFAPIESLHTFESGAQSSGKLPPFHLVPIRAVLDRLAPRFGIGAEKYGVGAWRKGLKDREWLLDRANHGLEHYLRMIEKLVRGEATDEGDDDLAGALWALTVIAESEWRHGPIEATEYRDDSRDPATAEEVAYVSKMEIRARERMARAALTKPIEVAPAPPRARLTCCMHCGLKAEEHLVSRGLVPSGTTFGHVALDGEWHEYEQPDGNYTGLRGVFD